ncbi:MAG: ATP-binding protein [Rhodobacteraceae bacterium]|nr:ATP-binding protein [Paracoccaceae bacterium]
MRYGHRPARAPCIDLGCAANPHAVRGILAELRARLAAMGVSQADLGKVELATAEALNNIVEHACATLTTADIRITAALAGVRLRLCLRDPGTPLPDERIPLGPRPDPHAPHSALPEGGFGWFLIRDLTEQVIYRRVDGENLLWLHFHLTMEPGKTSKP